MPVKFPSLSLSTGSAIKKSRRRVRPLQCFRHIRRSSRKVNRPNPIELLPRPTNVDEHFGQNPTVTTTALAHSLWSYVVRPGIDSAIDATAGNGHDSVALAKLLFNAVDYQDVTTPCELVVVDIQPESIQRTKEAVRNVLDDSSIFEQHVRFQTQSHSPLPLPTNPASVGLIAYNLGYLPNASRDGRVIMTSTETTLSSMVDAASILRVGGLLSIMTYPRSNPDEASVVRSFLQGLGLFSSKEKENLLVLDRELQVYSPELQDMIKHALHQVSQNQPGCKWRVHQHGKLGWLDAPVLYTATRLK